VEGRRLAGVSCPKHKEGGLVEEYPRITKDENVRQVLARIVDLREDDIDEIDEIQRLNSYESGFKRATVAVSANYSAGENDLYVDATGGAGGITVTLLDPPFDGQTHWIYKADAGAGAITIDGDSKNINGAGTISLANQYDWTCLVFMGAADEWRSAT